MILGIRAHDMGEFERPADLASAVKEAEFDTVQLVPWKSFSNVSRRTGIFEDGLAGEIRSAFEAEHIGISMLGAYFHWFSGPEDPGSEVFADCLAHAAECGTAIVGTEIQGITTDRWGENPQNDSEEAFSRAAAMLRKLDSSVHPAGVNIGIEGAVAHVPSTPEKVLKLKKDSGVTGVRFIFDLYNFLNAENWQQQEEIIDRALELYGRDLAVIHCKDFIPDGKELKQMPPGTGRMNYTYLQRRLREEGLEDTPMILEGVTGSDIRESSLFLRRLMDKV